MTNGGSYYQINAAEKELEQAEKDVADAPAAMKKAKAARNTRRKTVKKEKEVTAFLKQPSVEVCFEKTNQIGRHSSG
jgi:hypothetical protein